MTRLHCITLGVWALAVLTCQVALMFCAFQCGRISATLDTINRDYERMTVAWRAE
jgi:hypothetical protein